MKLGRYVTGLIRWTEVRDVAGNSRLVALATDVRGHHRCGRVWHLLRREASPGRLVRRPSNPAVDHPTFCARAHERLLFAIVVIQVRPPGASGVIPERWRKRRLGLGVSVRA